MIDLGKISLKDEVSIVESRNKIRLLAEDLKFGSIGATRLATITSELCRIIYQKDEASSILVGFDKRQDSFGLILIFQTRKEELEIGKAQNFFDGLKTARTKDGFQRIEAFKYIPDPEFQPTREFIDTERERLIRLSRQELWEEVKRKNEELLKLLDELKIRAEREKQLAAQAAAAAAEKKRAEELDKAYKQLKEMQEKLVRSEKLAALGKLAGSLSHELRNPLGVIKNAVYYLATPGLKVDKKTEKEYFDIIRRHTGMADNIISNALDFARPRELELRKNRVNKAIDESLSEVSIPENIKIEKDYKQDVEILFDFFQLKQAFSNIITNSIQAIKDKGRIKITTEKEKDSLRIVFEDNGQGIVREDLGKIFEPLFSRKIRGTGLGLTIVEGIIERHKGSIQVESQLGRGTKVIVKLPIREK